MTTQCEICGRELGGGHRKPGLSYECLRLGYDRLKAENASLREELEEARNEACVRCGFPTHDITSAAVAENASLRTALVNAEARCDDLAARGMRMDDELVATRKNARWSEDALEKAKTEWRAAEQRAEAAEKRAADLTPLMEAAERLRDQLEKYNTLPDYDLAFALEAADEVVEARAALHDEERSDG